MLKQLLISIFTLSSLALMAQAPLSSKHLKFKQEARPFNKVAFTGAEPVSGVHSNPNLPVVERTDVELTIGETFYDLQSNSGTPRRIASHTDGTRYATWTFGLDAAAGYPDRGTGLNIYDPSTSSWGDEPDARLEDIRTGWPNIGVLADGSPVVTAHKAGPEAIYVSRWVNNAWVHAAIPSSTPAGVIWPRMAIGGADGNSVHVLGLTYPSANGGVVYEGCDGHILYYRSLDGGATWDITDMKLPEIDNNFYTSMDADSYFIDALGETVVVGFFDSFGDVKVSKSTDNGDTWTTWTINDFPIDQYTIDQGYTTADIPFDPDAPDTLAIRTSDNTGAILIDGDGMAHVWFGQMYVLDADLTDANTSYFPATMGLRYWNEAFGEDSSQLIIPGIVDANGNDTLDIASADNIALYYSSMTSHPSAAMGADGFIYLAYSGVTEDFISPVATPNEQHCRHIYLVRSEDGGATWSDPIDVIREDLVIEPDLLNVYETMFPAIDRHVDSQIHLIYQADFEPGLSVRGDADAAAVNYINYLAVDISEFDPVNTEVVSPTEFAFQVSPNPASNLVKIAYELPQATSTSIFVYDMMGRQVKALAADDVQAAGSHNALFTVSDLTKGVYLVRLQAGDKVATQKIMVN